jgi:hypothetical protein
MITLPGGSIPRSNYIDLTDDDPEEITKSPLPEQTLHHAPKGNANLIPASSGDLTPDSCDLPTATPIMSPNELVLPKNNGIQTGTKPSALDECPENDVTLNETIALKTDVYSEESSGDTPMWDIASRNGEGSKDGYIRHTPRSYATQASRSRPSTGRERNPRNRISKAIANDAFKKHNKNDMDWKETQLKYLDRITSLGKKMAAAHGHLYSITKKYEQVVFDAFETLTANIDKENKVTVMIENIHEN